MVLEEEKVSEDEETPPDIRTARELRKMANTISTMVQMEEDTPSKHDDHKLPILDLKVWIEDEQLMYEFYQKPMTNPLLIMSKSAMPQKIKRTTLSQMALRVLLNTKPELEDRRTELLSKFSGRMRASGYGARFRQEIIASAMSAFDKLKKDKEDGKRPINRPRSFQAKERRSRKCSTKTEWFKKGNYTTVMFVPYTPGSRLAKILRDIEKRGADERDWRIKIVERSGQKLRSQLVKDPWAGPCSRPNCLQCRSAETRPGGGRGGPCNRNSICYSVVCRDCKTRGPDTLPTKTDGQPPVVGDVHKPMLSVYEGESSRNGYTRGNEHTEAVRKKNMTNALAKHTKEYHGGHEVQFDMLVTSVHKDPLSRQIQEGVNIANGGCSSIVKKQKGMTKLLLNSKLEYLQGAVPKTRIQRAAHM